MNMITDVLAVPPDVETDGEPALVAIGDGRTYVHLLPKDAIDLAKLILDTAVEAQAMQKAAPRTVDLGQGVFQMQDTSREAAQEIINAQVDDDEDGRSEWFWLRCPNGDLMFACYPMGDLYYSHEDERSV